MLGYIRYTLIFLVVSAAGIVVAADADSVLSSSGGIGAATKAASCPADSTAPVVGLSLFWENDGNFAKPNNSTDRDYSSGLGLAVQWQSQDTSSLVSEIPSLNQEFSRQSPGTSYAMGLTASMNIYTPDYFDHPQTQYTQHPYAGWTYGGLIVQRANRAADTPVQEHMELDVGTIGQASQAGKAQVWLHRRFSYATPEGWDNQIEDDFGADVKYLRRWRVELIQTDHAWRPGVQLLPEAGFTLGTMHDNLSVGATLRLGWNLPDDFGPARLRYAADYTRPFDRCNPLGKWAGYFFVRPGGRIVAHDSTIDGSFFRSNTDTQNSQVLVGEFQAGVAVQFLKYFEFSYSQTFLTPEYINQHDLDSYGSLVLTMACSW